MLHCQLDMYARSGDVAGIQRLIDQNYDLNRVDERGWSVIHCATITNQVDIINLLVTHGVDINTLNNDGRSAIYFAGTKETFELLRSLGARLDLIDNRGTTILHHTIFLNACDHNDNSLLSSVLSALHTTNIGPLTPDHNGRTPLDIAHSYGCDICVKLLENYVEDLDIKQPDHE